MEAEIDNGVVRVRGIEPGDLAQVVEAVQRWTEHIEIIRPMAEANSGSRWRMNIAIVNGPAETVVRTLQILLKEIGRVAEEGLASHPVSGHASPR